MNACADEIFWTRVTLAGPDECWQWTGGKTKGGYGNFGLRGSVGLSHRIAYETIIGIIPEGLDLDHLCRNPACVNPAHLEPVTHAENCHRGRMGAHNSGKEACPQGHPYTLENTIREASRGNGKWRRCRECRRQQAHARLEQRRIQYHARKAMA